MRAISVTRAGGKALDRNRHFEVLGSWLLLFTPRL
jgi:hypothetical protein